ncbi:MAG: hypothetical protein AB1765_06075 [Candidatus Hydrogenedentota bacterium]
MRFKLIIFMISVLLVTTNIFAYEEDTVFYAKDILEEVYLRGPAFTTDEIVYHDGLFYEFSISSKFGNYEAYSAEGLLIRKHELETMDRFEEIRAGDEVLKGFGNTLVGVGRGVGEAVLHPIETVKRLPKGIGKIFGRLIRIGKKHPAEENKTIMQVLSSGEKRKIAVELEVDVYSDNEKLQEMLYQLAKYRTVGGGSLKIGAFFIPGTAAVVYSIGSINQDVKNLIRDNNAIELEYINNNKLKDQAIDEELRLKFLKNTVFTPTDQTVIVECLEKIGALEGEDIYLELCSNINDKKSALFYRKTVEILLVMKEKGYLLEKIYNVDDVICALCDDMIFIVLPSDMLSYTPEIEELIKNTKNRFEDKSITLLTSGKISDRLKEYLENKTTIVFLEKFGKE